MNFQLQQSLTFKKFKNVCKLIALFIWSNNFCYSLFTTSNSNWTTWKMYFHFMQWKTVFHSRGNFHISTKLLFFSISSCWKNPLYFYIEFQQQNTWNICSLIIIIKNIMRNSCLSITSYFSRYNSYFHSLCKIPEQKT